MNNEGKSLISPQLKQILGWKIILKKSIANIAIYQKMQLYDFKNKRGNKNGEKERKKEEIIMRIE